MYWCSTGPTAMLDTSTMRQVGNRVVQHSNVGEEPSDVIESVLGLIGPLERSCGCGLEHSLDGMEQGSALWKELPVEINEAKKFGKLPFCGRHWEVLMAFTLD